MQDLTPEVQDRLRLELAAISARAGRAVTLNGLISDWRNLVSEVERGYELSFYDYTNDLSVRDQLDQLVAAVPPQARDALEKVLAPLDARFDAATEDAGSPLLARHSRWWRRVPRKREPEFDDARGGSITG